MAPRAATGSLLVATTWVYFFRFSPVATARLLRVPPIIDPLYWSGELAVVSSGLGCPGPLLGPAPRPLAFRTWRRPSSHTTALGYQPVGIRPSTLPVTRLITATSLLPELVTNNRVPPPSRARPVGLLPIGAFLYGRKERVRVTFAAARSIWLTESASPLATYSVFPSGESTDLLGCRPTLTWPLTTGAPPLTSRMSTLSPPWLEMYAVRPSLLS